MIPPRSNRKAPRGYDGVVYKGRDEVERCINRLEQFRRVATRSEETSRNFLGMALFAAITFWLE